MLLEEGFVPSIISATLFSLWLFWGKYLMALFGVFNTQGAIIIATIIPAFVIMILGFADALRIKTRRIVALALILISTFLFILLLGDWIVHDTSNGTKCTYYDCQNIGTYTTHLDDARYYCATHKNCLQVEGTIEPIDAGMLFVSIAGFIASVSILTCLLQPCLFKDEEYGYAPARGADVVHFENLRKKIDNGERITSADLVTPSEKKQQARNETKEIVKGAVVGGIIAGQAGAVVGAIVAKDKIDSEKGN